MVATIFQTYRSADKKVNQLSIGFKVSVAVCSRLKADRLSFETVLRRIAGNGGNIVHHPVYILYEKYSYDFNDILNYREPQLCRMVEHIFL